MTVASKASSPEKRYQGWIPLATKPPHGALSLKDANGTITLTAQTKAGRRVSLAVDKATPIVAAFALDGRVLSEELRPAEHLHGADCLPRNWVPLQKGQAASLSAPHPGDGCIRHTRSLRVGEDVYGFGQVPEQQLSAVGTSILVRACVRALLRVHSALTCLPRLARASF